MRQNISWGALGTIAVLLVAMVATQPHAEEPAITAFELNKPSWYEKLNETVELSYDSTPLAEVVDDLKTQFSIPIHIDTFSLEVARLTPDIPISGEFDDISLKAALSSLLREYELSWTVLDEQLVITTPTECEKHLITRIYPVGDLVRRPRPAGQVVIEASDLRDYDSLMDVITDTIAPLTWDHIGGVGSIEPFENGGVLVVSQTWHVLEQVEQFLETMRKAKTIALAGTEVALQQELDENDHVLRVYRVAPPFLQAVGVTNPDGEPQESPAPIDAGAWTADLGESIVEFIEPESWEAAGGKGKLRTVAGMIFVRQTPEIHAMIEAVLVEIEQPEPELEIGGGFGGGGGGFGGGAGF